MQRIVIFRTVLVGLIMIAALPGCVKSTRSAGTPVVSSPRPLDTLEPIGPIKQPTPLVSIASARRGEEAPLRRSAPPRVERSRVERPRVERSIPPPTNTYVIRDRDSLWSLARNHLGDSKRWPEIVDANPGLKAERLMIGQRIIMPQK